MTPCIIETTTATQAQADKIATILLERGLAACVQYETIRSRYLWQGHPEEATEIRLSVKSADCLYAAAEEAILAAHPYDCPQILAYPVTRISAAYYQWLTDCLTAKI